MHGKYGPLVLSARHASWRIGEESLEPADHALKALRAKVFERDNYTCQYCGYQARRFQELHHLDDNHLNNVPGNVVTICPLCHMSFHPGRVGVMAEAVAIWAPELTQEEINHIVRAIFVCDDDGTLASRGGYQIAHMFNQSRFTELRNRLGSTNPLTIAAALLRLEESEYQKRASFLKGVRLLPLGCKYVGGADIWPDMVSFWRGETGGFNSLPTNRWIEHARTIFGTDFGRKKRPDVVEAETSGKV